MSVHVKLSSCLRRYVPEYEPALGIYADGAGYTAASLALALGIPLRETQFLLINRRLASLQTYLETGDEVSYFPFVGGG